VHATSAPTDADHETSERQQIHRERPDLCREAAGESGEAGEATAGEGLTQVPHEGRLVPFIHEESVCGRVRQLDCVWGTAADVLLVVLVGGDPREARHVVGAQFRWRAPELVEPLLHGVQGNIHGVHDEGVREHVRLTPRRLPGEIHAADHLVPGAQGQREGSGEPFELVELHEGCLRRWAVRAGWSEVPALEGAEAVPPASQPGYDEGDVVMSSAHCLLRDRLRVGQNVRRADVLPERDEVRPDLRVLPGKVTLKEGRHDLKSSLRQFAQANAPRACDADPSMLTYRIGDATNPEGTDSRVLVHVCNDKGHWGAGFVLALSRRFKVPEEAYRAWARGEGDMPFELGQVQFVPVEPTLWVANLIGQHDIRRKAKSTGVPPVRYDAIRVGLARVRGFAREHRASVHMPRIGAGLAGGDWTTIEGIIREELADQGVRVTVYDLPPRA